LDGRISGSSGYYHHWRSPRPTGSVMRRVSRPRPQKDLLLSDYDYGEGAGLDFAAALAWGWWLKLGAGQKDLVRF